MDALAGLLERLRKDPKIQGQFLGLLHILIGRHITTSEGETVCAGLTWRDLAGWLKKSRWSPQAVRELGLEPQALPPRDRERYWYSAILKAGVDSEAARVSGQKLAAWLEQHGYRVST